MTDTDTTGTDMVENSPPGRIDIRRGDVVTIEGEDGTYRVAAVVDMPGQPVARLAPAEDRPDRAMGSREPALTRLVLVEVACTCPLAGALDGLHNNGFGDDPALPVCRVPSSPEALATRARMTESVHRNAREQLLELPGVTAEVVDQLLGNSEEVGRELNRSYNQSLIDEYGPVATS